MSTCMWDCVRLTVDVCMWGCVRITVDVYTGLCKACCRCVYGAV